jgi:hypothetical protein
LRADGFIIRAQAAIRTDGFFVRAGFANICALRAPTSFFVRIHTIRTKNGVLQVNPTQGEEEADVREPIQNTENGLPKDRRLRADGFIIRAQAAIRTDGFFVRAGFANICALRAPTSFFARIHTIRTKNGVLQVNRMFRPLTAPKVN